MTVYSDIRSALEAEIDNVVGIPAAAYRAWDNVDYTPTIGQPWVRMQIVPINSRPDTRGDNYHTLHTGLFVVDIFTPKNIGPSTADTLADAIRDRYKPEIALTSGSTNVRIRYCEKTQALVDESWYHQPVVIEWFSYET